MIEFKTSAGEILRFEDKPLSQGGEGAVYKQYDEHGHGDIGDLAKTFHVGKASGKEEKIKAMLSIEAPMPSSSFAWPKEILYDVETGEFRGYVMYMKYNKQELGKISAQDSEYRHKKKWLFYVNVAKNLARTISGLHKIDQVVGDLNDKNVLVDMDNAQVTLIDNDSFHITLNSITHRCSVGMGEYIAPEIQGINFREASMPTFTKNTDNFSLAILIFKLLMNGLHPFNSATIDDISIEENIKKGHSPFFSSDNKGKAIEPPYAPPIDVLPTKLYKMFKASFNDSLGNPRKRPTAQEYCDELSKLCEANSMEECLLHSHTFPKGLSSCPWCYVDEKMLKLNKGILSKDFTFGSYTKIYKESVSKLNKRKPNKHVTQSPEDTDYSDYAPKNQSVTSNNVSVQQNVHSSNILNTNSSNNSKETNVQPLLISPAKKTFCVMGCIGISLMTIAVCVTSFLLASPLISIVSGLLIAILAIINIPKFKGNYKYKTIVEFPDYITVKRKEKKTVWYIVVPKVKVLIFNLLTLSVMIILISAIGLSYKMELLWPFVAFSLLSIFNTFYVTDKRSLWKKTALGTILGVICIITIIISFVLFVNNVMHFISL